MDIASAQALVQPEASPTVSDSTQKNAKQLSRRLYKKTTLNVESHINGSVRIDICIDQTGKVVSATEGKIINITDASVIAKCIACAKKYEFESNPNAPERECGNVTFRFSVK